MTFASYVRERASSRKLLAPYLCAGYPSAETTVDVLCALAEGGADFIELGVPFSDPLADGPVIQAASASALAAERARNATSAFENELLTRAEERGARVAAIGAELELVLTRLKVETSLLELERALGAPLPRD